MNYYKKIHMFHVKQSVNKLTKVRAHELLFYVFLFFIPIQTRILYKPDLAYIGWYFNYHLAFFIYLSDILFFACFTSWIVFDRPKILINRLFWLILALFGLILLTLFHVKRLDLGLYQTLKWSEVLLIVFYVSQTFKTKVQFLISSWMIFTAALFQSLIGLIQFHMQHSINLGFLGEYIAPIGTPGLATIQFGGEKLIRAYGTFSHPNVLGAFLVLGLILGLFFVSRLAEDEAGESRRAHETKQGTGDRGQKKIMLLLLSCSIFLLLLAIFVTFSRLAWLAAVLAMISFIIYSWVKAYRSTTIVLVIVGLVSCATILIFGQGMLKSRVIESNSASVTDRSFFNRLGLELVSDKPMFGAGIGNYVSALQNKYLLEPWQYQPAHNIFIFIGAELGLVGLCLFILILFEIFSRLKNVRHETLTFTFAVLGIVFLLMSQFDHYFVTIQQGRLMFFTVLGMIAALPNIYAQKSD